jgi:hypothetical protein
MNIFHNLLDSFHNSPGGFSARKLSAFAGVAVCVYVTVHFCNDKILPEVLMVWLLFSLLCMGIITFQQVMDFKSGRTTSIEKTKIEKTEVVDTKTE